jgi:15-cis-phytoene synthase
MIRVTYSLWVINHFGLFCCSVRRFQIVKFPLATTTMFHASDHGVAGLPCGTLGPPQRIESYRHLAETISLRTKKAVSDLSPAIPSLSESYEACRVLTRRTAHNFRFSFLTLPREQRRSMNALYAFNRITDDLGDDESWPIDQRRVRLAAWRESIRAALAVAPPNAAVSFSSSLLNVGRYLPAIADMVARHRVPPEYLFAVIDGVEMDLHPVEVATFEELESYCYHVAGAVGLCCIHVWGFRAAPPVSQLAIDCGLALQLTNILRDLAEDTDRSRVYLPRKDLDRFGYSIGDLQHRVRDHRYRDLMQFEVDRAKTYYARGEQLIEHLEPPGQPILRAMLDIYGGLLREIERRNFDVFSQRVTLPKWKKLWFAGRAVLRQKLGGLR